MEETVSIIVPVYKAAAYIAETIEMVKRQTYIDWELILVDDCSPDNSADIIREICKEKSERIRLICKERNEGAAKARNTGVEAATGRYIAFLDADDIWLPNKLERELAFMKEKQAAFVFSAYEFGNENAKGTGKIVKVPEMLTYKKALTRTVIFTSTVMFDMTKLNKGQIHMPNVESEDTAAWWRILKAGYTAYGLNEVLAIYRRPAKSLSSNKITALRRIWNLYRKEEGLTIPVSAFCFCMWAVRATLRRI
ncbi:MAG: glycosyltransferase [Clostridiales bacterium]|nr:glycosyltransferase [Clostridiales bacterium]